MMKYFKVKEIRLPMKSILYLWGENRWEARVHTCAHNVTFTMELWCHDHMKSIMVLGIVTYHSWSM